MPKKARSRTRTVVTPRVLNLAGGGGSAVAESKKVYWKQILPQTSIDYVDDATGERRRLNFDRDYITDLKLSFEQGAVPQTAFVLAGKDNEHTMDPERYRGDVTEMVTEDELPESVRQALVAEHGEVPKGLYGRIAFASKKAAKSVIHNPKLGVSARIVEGDIERAGKKFKRAIIHVLGTLDPKIPGMAAWAPAVDLSEYASGQTLDLSRMTYTEASMAKGKKDKGASKAAQIEVPDIETARPEDVDDWSEEQVLAFIAAHEDEFPDVAAQLADDDEDDEDIDDDDLDDEDDDDLDDEDDDHEGAEGRELQEASLSNTARRQIDLANSQARESQRTAREALRRVADSEWRATRTDYLSAGVPPHIVDLAEPLLRGADDFVIDLSNHGGERGVNASDIVRKLVDGYRGTIDLSEVELGHGGSDGGDDPDAEIRDAFAKMTQDL
jgi:hypothetical protein